MSAPIHVLLAEKLDVSEERAQELLQNLVQEIRTQVPESGLSLPGLGTFEENEGEITFQSAPSLAQIVNHRFEGLESADLSTVPENQGKDDIESAFLSEGSSSTHGGGESTARPGEGEKTEDEESTPSDVSPEKREESSDTWDFLYEVAEEEAEESTTEIDELMSSPVAETEAESGAEETSTDRSSVKSASSTEDVRESAWTDPFRLVVGVLLLTVLVATGWFLVNRTGVFSGSESGPPPSAVEDGDTAPSPSDAGPTSAESSPESSSEDETSTPSESTTESDQTTADGADPGAGGWTIVVASLDDPSDAESYAEKYRNQLADLGQPVNVIESPVDNTTRYRVVVGQYGSREQVLSALKEHEDELPQGAWALPRR